MVFEEWAAFQSGLLLTVIFVIIIIAYFKLRERLFKLEKFLVKYKEEQSKEDEKEEKLKEV